MTLVQRAHFSNLKSLQTGPGTYSYLIQAYLDTSFFGNSSGISLSQLRSFDLQLMSLSVNYGEYLFYTTLAILGMTLGVLVLLLTLMSVTTLDHKEQQGLIFVKQMMCFIFVSMDTFLVLPILDCLMRTMKSCQDDPTLTLNTVILRYALSSSTLLLYLVILLYIIRVFNLQMPSQQVPWCAPISIIGIVNFTAQIILISSIVFDPNGTQILIELLALFLMFGLQIGYRILFKPMYVREIDIFYKSKEASLCLLYMLGVVCKLLQDTLNFDLVYFLSLVPFTLYFQFYCEGLRRQSIIEKLKTKSLKINHEAEFAVFVLMDLVNKSLREGSFQREAFGQIIDLMHSHIEDCEDTTCVCQEIENFYDLLQLRAMSAHQSDAPLMDEGYARFNKIIEDHGLVGTVSNMTDLNNNANLINDSHQNNHREEENSNGNQQHQEGYNRIFQVEMSEIKTRFLSEVMYMFCKEIVKKFPDSLQLAILNNHFTLHYKQKDILCAFQMGGFVSHKLSMTEQWQNIVNQQYLLQGIERMKMAHPNYQKFKQWIGVNDGDYFLKFSKLQKKFDVIVETMCVTVVNFWQNFLKQELDPDLMLLVGGQISKNIQDLFRVFIKIDEIQSIKDHQMFFKFALIQLQILNDPISYDLYIGKMKSILDVNKVYQKTLVGCGTGMETSNIIIIDGNTTNFGKIIQANANLRIFLGLSEEEINSMRIEQLMPQPIRQKHNIFVNKFLATGETYIMAKKTTMLIKKQNGHVIPVEYYIQFYYSIEYEYTFLSIIKPITHMAPFKNGIQYSVEQLVFLIVENDKEGHIYDFSESLIKMLESSGMKQSIDSESIIRRITDLMPNFNFAEFLTNRQERLKHKEIFEGEISLNLRQFTKEKNGTTMFGAQILVQSENEDLMTVNTRIFEERYSGGVLDINIFCFAFQDENQRNGTMGSLRLQMSNSAAKKHPAHDQIVWNNQHEGNNIDHYQDDKNSNSMEKEDEEHASNTGSQSSNGVSSISTSMTEFRSLHSVSDQQTPLTLLIIMRLITLLYLIMIVIASASLAINQQKQNQTMSDIQTVTQAYFRLSWAAINQRESRVLANIANSQEPQTSSIIPDDRFIAYQNMQLDTITKLMSTQAYLLQSSFQKSESFLNYEASLHVPLQYLSNENVGYTSNETINTALNSFFSASQQSSSFTQQQYITGINMVKIVPAPDPYSPNQFEQTIGFIQFNGIRAIRDSIFDEILLYCADMIAHSASSINTILITEIISIIAILTIGLVVAPMMTQIQGRKYKALHYFIKIPKDKLLSMIKNCQYCAQIADETQSIQVMMEYEQIIGIKLNNEQQEKLLRKSLILDEEDSKKMKQNQIIIENVSSASSSSEESSHRIIVNHAFNKKTITVGDIQKSSQISSSRQKMLAKIDSVSVSEKEESSKNDDEEKEEGQVGSAEDSQNAIKVNHQTINQYLQKKRMIMATSVLSVLMILTTYFIISYFLSAMTFNLAAEIVMPLEAILYKGSCFEQTMSFLRRNNIRNVTQNISSMTGGVLSDFAVLDLDSTTYFLSFCSTIQADFHHFNLGMPSYFAQVSQLIYEFEYADLCELYYKGQSQYSICKTGLNGLFPQQGMSDAFSYMFRVVQLQNMEFTELGPTYFRNASVLEAMESDPLIVEIIDYKAIIIDPILSVFKDQCMQSIVDYIQSLLNNFIIAYIVFVVILSLGMLFLITFGFRSLKRNMLDTNIMLRIIPFETLEKMDREEVIQFFRN